MAPIRRPPRRNKHEIEAERKANEKRQIQLEKKIKELDGKLKRQDEELREREATDAEVVALKALREERDADIRDAEEAKRREKELDEEDAMDVDQEPPGGPTEEQTSPASELFTSRPDLQTPPPATPTPEPRTPQPATPAADPNMTRPKTPQPATPAPEPDTPEPDSAVFLVGDDDTPPGELSSARDVENIPSGISIKTVGWLKLRGVRYLNRFGPKDSPIWRISTWKMPNFTEEPQNQINSMVNRLGEQCYPNTKIYIYKSKHYRSFDYVAWEGSYTSTAQSIHPEKDIRSQVNKTSTMPISLARVKWEVNNRTYYGWETRQTVRRCQPKADDTIWETANKNKINFSNRTGDFTTPAPGFSDNGEPSSAPRRNPIRARQKKRVDNGEPSTAPVTGLFPKKGRRAQKNMSRRDDKEEDEYEEDEYDEVVKREDDEDEDDEDEDDEREGEDDDDDDEKDNKEMFSIICKPALRKHKVNDFKDLPPKTQKLLKKRFAQFLSETS